MLHSKPVILGVAVNNNPVNITGFNNSTVLKLLKYSFEAIVVLDQDLQVVFSSESAANFIGLEPSNIVGNQLLSLVPVSDHKLLKDFFSNLLKTSELTSLLNFRLIHFNGNFISVECAFTNYLNDLDVKAIICNLRNLTETKRADDLRQNIENELFAYKYALQESSIIAITNQKGIIKHVNQNFCNISGYTKEELIGKDHRIINSGFHKKEFIREIWTTIAGGNIWKGELKNKTKSGSYYWVDTTIVPFLNEFGKPYQYIAIRSDITERKIAEEKIIESEHFIKTITDNLPAMISYWNIDLICLFANKPYSDYYNKETNSIVGISKRALFGTEEFAERDDQIKKVLNGTPQRFETSFQKQDGSSIYMFTQFIPDIQNEVVKGFYSLTYDYTDLVLAQTELKKKTEQIEDLLENISDGFIGLNENLNYTYANKRIGEMLGMDPCTLIGKNIWDLFPDAVGSATYKAITSALIEKKQVTNEDYYEPLNLWQENRVYPTSTGVSMFIRDITEKKELEELLNKATTLARIGSWEVDLVLNKVYWSKITKEIYDVLPDFEPDFAKDLNFYPEGENRDKIVSAIDQAIKTGQTFDVELQILSANGIRKWVRAIGEAEFKLAQCLRVYGSIQDIDQRKRAEIAGIHALEERNTILESIDDAFFAVDNNWIITYWNTRAEKMLGKPKSQMLNNNLWDFFSSGIESEAYKKYNFALTKKEAVHFENFSMSEQKWFEISAYPSISGLSVYFKDITSRKESDIQLHELNENLQKHAKELAISNAELEQFAYVASHDLQEPLRMVTSFLSQLERKYAGVLDDKGNQYIQFAVDGAKRMRQIILDLLDFSKVGQTDDDIEPININKLISEILILYRKQTEELDANIIYDNLPIVYSYKTPMRQVFQNLISNGLKYHRTGIAPQIIITCKETETQYIFSVQDNGIGIEPAYFEKIFIIFQRLHNKDEYTGTGMGLAIAKKIIENLGGKIWVESSSGNGSIFYFSLLKTNLP